MINRITVNIDELPPSPNRTRRSSHWVERASLDRKWRLLGFLEAVSVIEGRVNSPKWERVRVSMHFYLPDHRRRDPGNLVGSEAIKALIDGIVDAGVITDDNINVITEYGPFTWEYRKGKPGVAVTVEPI